MNRDVELVRSILRWSVTGSQVYAESVNTREKKREAQERTREAQEAVLYSDIYACEAAVASPRMLECR